LLGVFFPEIKSRRQGEALNSADVARGNLAALHPEAAGRGRRSFSRKFTPRAGAEQEAGSRQGARKIRKDIYVALSSQIIQRLHLQTGGGDRASEAPKGTFFRTAPTRGHTKETIPVLDPGPRGRRRPRGDAAGDHKRLSVGQGRQVFRVPAEAERPTISGSARPPPLFFPFPFPPTSRAGKTDGPPGSVNKGRDLGRQRRFGR